MTDGVLRLSERFIQPREVVVAVGQIRILGERGLVCLERGGRIAQILEQYALVEEQQRIRPRVVAGESCNSRSTSRTL